MKEEIKLDGDLDFKTSALKFSDCKLSSRDCGVLAKAIATSPLKHRLEEIEFRGMDKALTEAMQSALEEAGCEGIKVKGKSRSEKAGWSGWATESGSRRLVV